MNWKNGYESLITTAWIKPIKSASYSDNNFTEFRQKITYFWIFFEKLDVYMNQGSKVTFNCQESSCLSTLGP